MKKISSEFPHTFRHRATHVLYSILLILYAGLVWVIAQRQGVDFNSAEINTFFLRSTDLTIFPLMFIALICVPGLLLGPGYIGTIVFRKIYPDWLTYGASLCAYGSIILIGTMAALTSLTSLMINRSVVLLSLSVLLCGSWGVTKKLDGRQIKIDSLGSARYWFKAVIIGLILSCSIFIVFYGKFVFEDMSLDGLEAFRMAQSLRLHPLPYGYLEGGLGQGYIMHIVYLMQGYLGMFLLTLVGESIVSIRFSYLFIIFTLYLISLFLIFPASKNNRCIPAIVVALQLFLYTVIVFFYTSYNIHFADIAADPVMETLFAIFLILEVYFLINKETFLFITFALFSMLTLMTGAIFTFFIICGYLIFVKNNRLYAVKAAGKYIFAFGCMGGIYLLVGLAQGSLSEWGSIFHDEYISEYLLMNQWDDIFNFLKYFIAWSGGISFISLFLLWGKDKMANVLSFTVLAYLCFALGGGYKNMHFFTPIAVLPIIIYFRRLSVQDSSKFNGRALIAGLSIVILLIITFPKKLIAFDYFQTFGSETFIQVNQTNDEELHELIHLAFADRSQEWIDVRDIDLWLIYADTVMQPDKSYDYYFTKTDTSPDTGVRLVNQNESNYYWTRGSRNITETMETMPTRKEIYPPFFKGLIDNGVVAGAWPGHGRK